MFGCVVDKPTTEPYRPAFHFTPPSGWMNDPNGMFYYAGEYHLFYQHYPDSTVWGPMHWGHAVSNDLIHWQHLPIALYPDSIGYIFSGSAVVDWNNTSGFGKEPNNPPLLAIFTYHNMAGEKAGRIDFQTQGIAYSLDKGRTWTKYDQNPVLKNPGIKDFRDPKVSWNNVAQQWVMTLAVKDHIEFYASKDFKQWTKLSEFGLTLGAHGGVWECPDLFPLQDEEGKTHWVLLVSINPGGPQGGSATQYFIGDFDGKNFTAHDSATRWIDYGADNYAGVTWSDIPAEDGRRLFMGWMSNWQYAQVVPTKTWRSAMTLPRELTVIQSKNGFVLVSKPIQELIKLYGEAECFTNKTSSTIEGSHMINFSLLDADTFKLELTNSVNEKVSISNSKGVFSVNRAKSGMTSFSSDFQQEHQVLMPSKVYAVTIYLDAASIEIFINEGETVMTELLFPTKPYDKVSLIGPKEYCIRKLKPIEIKL